jgi:hypothetical protein
MPSGPTITDIRNRQWRQHTSCTSGLNAGRYCLCSSMMILTHTCTFSSLSICRSFSISVRIGFTYGRSISFVGRRGIISRINLRTCCNSTQWHPVCYHPVFVHQRVMWIQSLAVASYTYKMSANYLLVKIFNNVVSTTMRKAGSVE